VDSEATMLFKVDRSSKDLVQDDAGEGAIMFQMGEPFFFYNVMAEIAHKGEFKEYVLVNEEVLFKKHNPYVFLF
jgi:hypothetical protein